MKIIKEFDYGDYKVDGTVGIRPSVRAIIIRENKLALVYSKKHDYYTFAGGGIEAGETNEEALIREIREELGLNVILDSIEEYGLVLRRESGKYDDLFIQENYFYVCEVRDDVLIQQLDDYEKQEGYKLEWVAPQVAMEVNSTHNHQRQENIKYCERLMDRENWMINRLISEGRFK